MAPVRAVLQPDGDTRARLLSHAWAPVRTGAVGGRGSPGRFHWAARRLSCPRAPAAPRDRSVRPARAGARLGRGGVGSTQRPPWLVGGPWHAPTLPRPLFKKKLKRCAPNVRDLSKKTPGVGSRQSALGRLGLHRHRDPCHPHAQGNQGAPPPRSQGCWLEGRRSTGLHGERPWAKAGSP